MLRANIEIIAVWNQNIRAEVATVSKSEDHGPAIGKHKTEMVAVLSGNA
jgi:hypothetical protein